MFGEAAEKREERWDLVHMVPLGQEQVGSSIVAAGICILRNMYLRLYRRAPEPTESRCQADEARGALVGSDLDNLAASRHFQLGGSPTKRLKSKDDWLV